MSKTRDLANLADLNFDSGTMVVDKVNDRVGVGTSSPSEDLHIKSQTGAHADVIIEAFTGYNSGLNFHDNAGMAGRIVYNHSNNFMEFDTNGSEAARLDASGNLLVGKTSSSGSNAGAELRSNGRVFGTSNGVEPLFLNRLTSDGTIATFRKDGTTVGSIGTDSGDLTIDGAASHSGLRFITTYIQPRLNGSGSNGGVDLGAGASRFKDLYLSGGVYLGGTGSANHLDDYEEGSFGLSEVQGSITGDTSRSGRYVKIGRMVMIDFAIAGTALTIPSYVGFSSLPFTPSDSAAGYASTEDIDLANGVEVAVGTNGVLYLSGGGGSDVSRFSGSIVYRTA